MRCNLVLSINVKSDDGCNIESDVRCSLSFNNFYVVDSIVRLILLHVNLISFLFGKYFALPVRHAEGAPSRGAFGELH